MCVGIQRILVREEEDSAVVVYHKTILLLLSADETNTHACGVLKCVLTVGGYWVWVGWSEEYCLTDLERANMNFITL